ncbi:CsgG/HfaB family protein [Marinobacter sp. C2H3]|uniref:CsgG/HfaB family protein n=1 Tax=Marinobacter sp. C2H3 TaxID=3119003 RepID=UPI00300E8268
MKKIGATLALFSALLLSAGCSTVTQPVENSLPQKAQVSPVLAEQGKTLKRKVAIARFSNETKHGNSFLLDNNNDRIGKQAMDILSARLTETGKFLMLERADLGKVREEQSLDDLDSQRVGADYLIIGSVSEFGRSTESEVGIFSRNKVQTARAKVNVRLVDVHTGQIVFAQEGAGTATAEANRVFGVGNTAGYDSSLDDAALSSAISKLVSELIGNLMDKPWRAYIIGHQDGFYLVTGGKAQGIELGDTFPVMQPGKKVKNPQTGMMIELPGTQVATLKVASFAGEGTNEISLATLVDGNLTDRELDKLIVAETEDK